MHEIPQNIGNYGVLLYAKIGKLRALILNFSVALTVILGGIIGFFFASYAGISTFFLLPFAAGGFIYIAASDLIPEIRKETGLAMSALNFCLFIIGIGIIYFL